MRLVAPIDPTLAGLDVRFTRWFTYHLNVMTLGPIQARVARPGAHRTRVAPPSTGTSEGSWITYGHLRFPVNFQAREADERSGPGAATLYCLVDSVVVLLLGRGRRGLPSWVTERSDICSDRAYSEMVLDNVYTIVNAVFI
jgi:hypothetical protein